LHFAFIKNGQNGNPPGDFGAIRFPLQLRSRTPARKAIRPQPGGGFSKWVLPSFGRKSKTLQIAMILWGFDTAAFAGSQRNAY
jgi:hypothetical protein